MLRNRNRKLFSLDHFFWEAATGREGGQRGLGNRRSRNNRKVVADPPRMPEQKTDKKSHTKRSGSIAVSLSRLPWPTPNRFHLRISCGMPVS